MSAQVTITQLPAAGAITGTESVPIVQNGVTVQTTTGAISASPSQIYTYLTVSQTPQLANSRYFGATNGLTVTDGGAQGVFNVTTTGALSSLVSSGTGIQVKTSSTALTGRSVASSGAGLTVTDGSGVSGDPTVALSGQVANLANASFNGLVVLSTGGAITSAIVTGTANQIDVANGTGVSGNPTVSLANDPVIPGTGGVVVPAGTTGQRGTAVNGNFRYNSTTASFEGYANGLWGTIPSGVGVNSISFGTTGLTPATATTGAVTVAGTLAVANGGTGVTTSTGTTNVVLSNSPTLVTPALGTPSSGTVTNLTGTASININGTVGATTATTGAFTSVTASTTLGVTGVSTFAAGTAALPGLTTTGDTNTGIFFPAADTLGFTTGGTERMRIDSAGNVGIGGGLALSYIGLYLGKNITGNANSFGVYAGQTVDSASATGSASIFSTAVATTAGTTTSIRHYNAGQGTFTGTVSFQFGFEVSPALIGATSNYGFYSNIASGTNRFNFYAAGTAANLFAGVSQFAAGTAALPGITQISDLNTGIFFPAADTLGFTTGGTERMRIDSAGNVGIGSTANASAILDAQSTTKGVRMPNMTTTQKNAIASPAAGLIVFDTTLAKLAVYSGTAWETVTSI